MTALTSPAVPPPDSSVEVGATPDPVSVLSTIAAVLALGAGAIHLAVVRHHPDAAVVATGFVLMGLAQLLVALRLRTAPTRRARAAGVWVHVSILATWLLSRTFGLLVVPGAEDRAAFGLADVVANLLGAAVVVALVLAAGVERRPAAGLLTTRTAHRVTVAVAVTAILMAVPAVLAPHHHGGHIHADDGGGAPEADHPTLGDDHDAGEIHGHG